jgi:hypothetical protein
MVHVVNSPFFHQIILFLYFFFNFDFSLRYLIFCSRRYSPEIIVTELMIINHLKPQSVNVVKILTLYILSPVFCEICHFDDRLTNMKKMHILINIDFKTWPLLLQVKHRG